MLRAGIGGARRSVLFALFFAGVLALAPAASRASNAAQTIHYTASGFNGPGGYFNCSGERIVRSGPSAVVKDSETCTMSDISTFPPGRYVGNPFVVINGLPQRWASDFDGQIATSVIEVVTDNGDGTGTLQITAYYG